MLLSQDLRNLPNDSRSIVSHDFHSAQLVQRGWPRNAVALNPDGQSLRFEGVECRQKLRLPSSGDLDAEDAGELATELSHATFQPVTTVICNHCRQLSHQAGSIRADNRHYQGSLHIAVLR